MNDKMIALYLTVMERFRSLKSSERGQTVVEYGLILVLIAIAAIVVMKGVGTSSSTAFSKVNSALQ